MSAWLEINRFGGRNYVLECSDFYVSYNPATGDTAFGAIFAGDGDGEETALVKDDRFYILNGDYRCQYEKLSLEGFDACKRFYDQQSAHAGSSWSVIGDPNVT